MLTLPARPSDFRSIDAALDTIAGFDPDVAEQLAGSDEACVERLEAGFGRSLPDELRGYVRSAVPSAPLVLERGGNPISLRSADQLGRRQDGYSFNPVAGVPISEWSAAWFLLGDEGADPIIVCLGEPAVLQATHGAGAWEFSDIASSIAQFLLCATAVSHALCSFGPEAEVDDDDGFNLAPEPAAWLFPRMRQWAGDFYFDWCSLWENC